MPICKEDTECKRTMNAAYVWVSKNCDMKVQISNDFSIETFNAVQPYQWACKVMKTPNVDGSYQLELIATCGSCSQLGSEPFYKQADFNKYVRAIMNPVKQ